MGRLITCLLLVLLGAGASAQRLVDWTEGPGELGLGYPVPIPVDTALPFNGFRTYQGLFVRHQNFMLTRDLVDGFVVGRTMENREIWAYRLGDPDFLTPTGLPESAVMIQGGIHAREWQSPEVLTGLMEWLLLRADDDSIHEYLLDHMSIVTIPVLNVDGFLQTQRYPRSNYLDSDPDSGDRPRDGRMRRKNMRSVDQDLFTVADHLLGVDLNRNNAPFWNRGGSSGDRESIVYRGTGPESEPEIRAMISATELAPASRLRAFTDVHSFSQLIYSIRTDNSRRNTIQSQLLADFTAHHAELPGNKIYPEVSFPLVGSTDEYFAFSFQVPSWTLEIEPSDGRQSGLPGGGADYGGLGSNSHDGFILPANQIRRVRDTLAESLVVVYYHQAGPPSVAALRLIDSATGAVVYDAEWDVVDAETRVLHVDTLQPLETGRGYRMWVAFDKPMRYRQDGLVVALPGQPRFGNSAVAGLSRGGQNLPFAQVDLRWVNSAGGSPDGYLRYADDTFVQDFVLAESSVVEADGVVNATLEIAANDMVGQNTDADPSTPVDWGPGNWIGYEGSDGNEGDIGGIDRTLQVPITAIEQPPAFMLQPGNTAAYFDPTHAGEGFLLEVLEDQRLVIYWFTYDEVGNQRWFIGEGEIRGNEAVFEDLLVARGGRFGPAFDPNAVVLEDVGRLSLLFSDCDTASMRFATPGKIFRQDLIRLSQPASLGCTAPSTKALRHLTGSWYDPDRAGEGFVVQALNDSRALVYWFTYDANGRQAWFFGDGRIASDLSVEIDALRPVGGEFGDDFDPQSVVLDPWGSMRFQFACETGSVDYAGPDGFGSGSISLVRLTRPTGLDACSAD